MGAPDRTVPYGGRTVHTRPLIGPGVLPCQMRQGRLGYGSSRVLPMITARQQACGAGSKSACTACPTQGTDLVKSINPLCGMVKPITRALRNGQRDTLRISRASSSCDLPAPSGCASGARRLSIPMDE